MFSGTYKVNYVYNHFKNGKFTQTLELARLPNQDLSLTAIGSSIVSAIGGTAAGKALGIGTDAQRMGSGTQTDGRS